MDKLLEFPVTESTGSKGRKINLFQMVQHAKKPVNKKPVELPEILLNHRDACIEKNKADRREER